jgi:subtilase family serine protease
VQNLFTGARDICLAATILFLIPSLTPAQTINVQPRITAVIDEADLTTLRGNTHPLARPEFDRGAAPSPLPMQRMLLVLKRSPVQESALDALLEQQQNASSPNYHQWLTPKQFGQYYGPAEQDIQTLTTWLQSHGFAVNQISNGRTVVDFTGTAGQVREAFHTEIHKYTIDGEDHWANSSDPQIPMALRPVVGGIATLHNFPRQPMHHIVGVFSHVPGSGRYQPLHAPKAVSKLFTVDATCGLEAGPCYALGPYDFATIYNVLPLWNAASPIDGTGQTIAIVGQSDIYPQDVSNFRSDFGLPAPSLNIFHNGSDPGKLATEGDEAESDLDVEWAGAVAKGATIDFVVSATTNTTLGVDLSALYAVDNNLAPILSESYGICEFFLGTTGNQFYNQLWQQAAAEGITALVATGDSGSAVCDRNAGTQGGAEFGLSVSGVSSTPYNLAVGGTDFNDLQNPTTYWNSTNNSTTQASAKGYIPEMTWNDSCTNQEVMTFLGLPAAEETCNNSAALSDGFVNAIGASGGKSSCTVSDGQNESSCSGGYPKPPWQTGNGVPDDGGRDVPDVSLFAADGLNANFYVICETDIFGGCAGDPFGVVGIGGTSASTPAFAGIVAMVNQKTQSRQGNANYVLYQLAAQSGASCNSSGGAEANCAFYDVTNGTIAMPCASGSPNCNISTTGDQVGLLFANNEPAYNAVPGYDLATGLGSVNAANLVNQWAAFSLSLKPSSTSLALNAGGGVNITHGQPVGITASVGAIAPATGIPTGALSLIAHTGPDGQEGIVGFQLTNGSVASTTNTLPGGNYTVTAHYPGDGTFAASDSSPGVNVTVNAEPSTATVQAFTIDQNGNSIPFTTGPFGAGIVYLRTNVAGQSGAGIATGTVNLVDTFSGMTTNFSGNPYQLNTGGNTMTPLPDGFYVFPSPGTHSIVATYSGDVSFTPSTSQALKYTISKAQTSTATTNTSCAPGQVPCTVFWGSQFTISASVSDSSSPVAPPPTGTVAFYSNGTQLGSPVVLDPGIVPALVNFSTNQLPLGQNNITEKYSGDANYVGSVSSSTLVDVVITTTTALTPSSTMIQSGQSVTFTVQVMPTQTGGPTLTGNVQFLSNGSDIGSPVTLSGGQAQFTTASLPAGLDQITAAYSGDSNYLGSSAVVPVTVTGSPTFTLSANPTTILVAAPGQSGMTELTITAQNGFSSNGAMTAPPACSGLPPETGCSIALFNLPANGTATVAFYFLTTAPSEAVPSTRQQRMFDAWPTTNDRLALTLVLCLGITAFILSRMKHRWSAVLTLVALAFLLADAGCGGGGGGGTGSGGNPGTPRGNYPGISVTLTINGVTQTIPNLTLSVGQ